MPGKALPYAGQFLRGILPHRRKFPAKSPILVVPKSMTGHDFYFGMMERKEKIRHCGHIFLAVIEIRHKGHTDTHFFSGKQGSLQVAQNKRVVSAREPFMLPGVHVFAPLPAQGAAAFLLKGKEQL